MAVEATPGECTFADCTHPAHVTRTFRSECGHYIRSNTPLCYCCSVRRAGKSERPHTCKVCGKVVHVTN